MSELCRSGSAQGGAGPAGAALGARRAVREGPTGRDSSAFGFLAGL